MQSDQLSRFREALTTHEDAIESGRRLREIVLRDGVEGEQLKTSPRGTPKDAVNTDLLRYKALTISSRIPFDNLSGEVCHQHVAALWTKGHELNEWLDRFVGPSLQTRM